MASLYINKLEEIKRWCKNGPFRLTDAYAINMHEGKVMLYNLKHKEYPEDINLYGASMISAIYDAGCRAIAKKNNKNVKPIIV